MARGIKLALRVAWLSLLCLSLVLLAWGEQEQGSPPAPSSWPVTCVHCIGRIPPNTRLTLSLSKERIELSGSGNSTSVPVGGVVTVISGSRRRYPAWDAQMKAWRVWSAATSGYGLAFFPFGVPLLVGSLGFKSRDYMIDILWNEEGVEQDVLLAIRKEDYGSLITELGRATGKALRNLEAELARLQQEIKSNPGNQFSVSLERRARVAGVELNRGTYRVVFLPGPKNLGELYFFRGQSADIALLSLASPVALFSAGTTEPMLQNPAKREIVATAKAEVIPQPSGATRAKAVYQEQHGVPVLVEIRTPERVFHLPSPSSP